MVCDTCGGVSGTPVTSNEYRCFCVTEGARPSAPLRAAQTDVHPQPLRLIAFRAFGSAATVAQIEERIRLGCARELFELNAPRGEIDSYVLFRSDGSYVLTDYKGAIYAHRAFHEHVRWHGFNGWQTGQDVAGTLKEHKNDYLSFSRVDDFERTCAGFAFYTVHAADSDTMLHVSREQVRELWLHYRGQAETPAVTNIPFLNPKGKPHLWTHWQHLYTLPRLNNWTGHTLPMLHALEDAMRGGSVYSFERPVTEVDAILPQLSRQDYYVLLDDSGNFAVCMLEDVISAREYWRNNHKSVNPDEHV